MMRAPTWLLATMLSSSLWACGDDQPAPLPEVTSATAWVDPRIGTGGLGFAHGSCFVGAAVPHGLAKPAPDTSGLFGTVSFQHYSGYFAEDDRIRGFSSLHLHGTGATDYGVLSLMPTIAYAFDGNKTKVTDYEAHFDKADEHAEPGYYSVKLGSGIFVELTATAHVALHRYTMPDTGSIVIDLHKVLDSGSVDSASIAADDTTHELTGELHHLGGMSKGFGGYTVYFAIRADRGWQAHDITPDGAVVHVDAGAITFAIGLSLVSAEGARKNLDAEAQAADFDAARDAARAAWEDVLGVVKLTGGTEAQRRTFYTSLYHAFLMPSVISDVDGTYQLAGAPVAQATDFTMMSDFSLWDTYRAVSPLYAWLAPQSARDTARSLLAFAQGIGVFPKWPLAIGETGTMLGASAEIAIADAVMRGVDNTHADEAWPLLRAAAMDPIAPAAGRGGRSEVEPYMQLGYVPTTSNRSVSVTAEYAHDDFALGNLAGALGHDADRDALLARSHGWRALYDPSAGFLRGKNADGTFGTDAFDPLVWRDDYAEADAWQSLFEPGIVDPDGMSEVLGGPSAAIDKLTDLFTQSQTEQTNAGESAANFPRTYYWAGNEPDHNAAYLFSQLGRPDLTQKWVRWLVDTLYSDQPDGVPGNDDGGAMGSWYVLSTLGVYPIAGSDRWILGAPRFPQARIVLPTGELVIRAEGSGMYVSAVELDGRAIDRPELTQAELAAAHELVFHMSDDATHWGR